MQRHSHCHSQILNTLHKVVSVPKVTILKCKHFAKYPRFAYGCLFSYHIAFKTLEMQSQTTYIPPPRDLGLRPCLVRLRRWIVAPRKKSWLRAYYAYTKESKYKPPGIIVLSSAKESTYKQNISYMLCWIKITMFFLTELADLKESEHQS